MLLNSENDVAAEMSSSLSLSWHFIRFRKHAVVFIVVLEMGTASPTAVLQVRKLKLARVFRVSFIIGFKPPQRYLLVLAHMFLVFRHGFFFLLLLSYFFDVDRCIGSICRR